MKFNLLYFLVFYLLLGELSLQAQCPSADFSLPAKGCLDQKLNIDNTSTDLTSEFVWDFCSADLTTTPTGTYLTTANGTPFKVDIKNVNGNFYGFFFSRANTKLYRIDFGTSLSSAPLGIYDLGDLGLSSNQLLSIKIVEEAGSFYGFIIQFTPAKLHRINFGTSITNLPQSVTDLGNFGLIDQTIDLEVAKDETDIVMLVLTYSGKIVRLNFGSSVLNPAPSAVAITVTGGSALAGIAIQHECNNWYAVVSSMGTNSIIKATFGTSLSNTTPTINTLTLSSPITSPAGIAFVREGEKYYAFVQSLSATGELNRIEFSTLTNNSVTVTNLGNLGVISNNWAFSMYEHEGQWFGFSSSNGGSSLNGLSGNINRIVFSNNCGITPSWYKGTTPPTIQFSQAGNRTISLTATNSSGDLKSTSKSLVVQALQAPAVSIQTDLVQCAQVSKAFSIDATGLASATWNFGDGNSALTFSTSHAYVTPGTYMVNVSATGTNTCTNIDRLSVKIFNAPVSSFNAPSNNPLCTNQQLQFTNTTTFDVGSNPTWEWSIDGSPVSTAKDLQHIFTTSASPSIKLKATIPGCVNEVTQVLTSLLAGPNVDFTTAGNCSNDAVTFTNTTVDPVLGYEWDFDDGQTSTSPNTNVFHTYTAHGTYDVSLMGSSANGCQNTKTKSITIYTKPQPDFSLSLPPFSCSGATSQFNDLTPNPVDSNLSSWLWDFNDVTSTQNSSSQRHPQHVYDNAGPYQVSLTVTTNFGCSATLKKQISIAQSPLADFTNTPSCKDQPVTFTDASNTTIKSWYWQIGSASYYFAKPVHIFTNTGGHTVNLTVTGSNDCISYVSKTVNVPLPVTPDFSFQKNCNNQNTIFTDITATTADAVNVRDWEFGGLGTGTGSSAQFTFPSPGNAAVKLTVTTVSGCAYSTTKTVPILNAPVASFTASPESGVPPLTVNFTNTSTNATAFNWAFNDANSSVSQAVSPVFVFTAFGDYVVDLTATNAQGCSSVSSKLIKAILPVKDIMVMTLTTVTNPDGSLKIVAALKNNSNVEVTGFPIALDLSGFATVREKVAGPIAAGAVYNHVFSYELSEVSRLNFLCATAENGDDINPSNNTKCASLGAESVLFEPYPNPANEALYIKWIANDSEPLLLTLTDAIGKQVFSATLQSVEGINTANLPVADINNGLYVLILKTSNYTKKTRLVISH